MTGRRKYVAFLRGINVGGHRVKMERLRDLFEDLDLADVSTVLASGNVIFSTTARDVDAQRCAIERHLGRELGYEVPVLLRTPAELAAIASVEGPPERSHYVMLLQDPAPDTVRSAFADLRSEIDDFVFEDREIHWFIDGKLSESPLFGDSRLDRATAQIPTTMRNMNTIRRLVAAIPVAPG
jgi:uncharacterized protein (DUF1697 family)